MKIDYSLAGHSARGPMTGMVASTDTPSGRPPRIACQLALAHRFETLVQSGEVSDYADLARLGRVSRARVNQIMNLLTLAPSIQEYILMLPPRTVGEPAISERHLRRIVGEPLWQRQRGLFEQFLSDRREHDRLLR